MGKFKGKKFDREDGARKFGGKPSFGGRSFGGDRNYHAGHERGGFSGRQADRSDRSMFRATCSGCGKDCEVPFRPNGERPVYCSDCFRRERGDERDSRFSVTGDGNFKRNRDEHPRHGAQEQYPPRQHTDTGRFTEVTKVQFDLLHTKIDRILKILEQGSVKKSDTSAGASVALPVVVTVARAEKEKVARPTKEPKKTVNTKELKKTLVKAVAKNVPTKKESAKSAPRKAVKKVPAKK